MNIFVVEIVSSYTWSKVATKDARSALFTRQSHYPLFPHVSNKSRSILSTIMSLTEARICINRFLEMLIQKYKDEMV